MLSKGARHNYIEITTTALGNSIKKSQQSASRHLADLERDGFVERGASTSGRSMSIRVTKRGLDVICHIYALLKNSVNPADSDNLACVTLTGVLVSGMGEGAYYIALDGYSKQFQSEIGYVPFPGTLNVKLQRREHKEIIRRLKSENTGRIIKSFSDGRRTFGWAKCFPALLRVNDFAQLQQQQLHSQHLQENNISHGLYDDNDCNNNTSDDCAQMTSNTNHHNKVVAGILCDLIILERTHHDDSIIELISKTCLRKAASISDGSIIDIEILCNNI